MDTNITNITITCSGNDNYHPYTIYREFKTNPTKSINKINKININNNYEETILPNNNEIDEDLLIENEKRLINTIENRTFQEYKEIYDNINNYLNINYQNNTNLIKERNITK
ncbi:MAG: hypothetical protein Q4Q23_07500 [Methanobacteriaceae archaeon]|nr:hypothetical protein [Methanobacteriaceae archaeon]